MNSINYQSAVERALAAVVEADDLEQDYDRDYPHEVNASIRGDIANALARAQVYATLALAAANVP